MEINSHEKITGVGDKDFERKKKEFFRKMALRYKQLMKLHRESGQTTRDARFGKDVTGRSKRWGDPTQHCLVEAAIVEILTDMVHLEPKVKNNLIVAALVHDWRKRGEIEELQGETKPTAVELSYQKSKEGLLERGINPKAIELTEYVAHTSLPRFATVQADNSLEMREGIPIENMIIHYVDDIVRGTEVVELNRRMDYLDEVAPVRYPYNENGKKVWGGRTFIQTQREIGHMIEERLAKRVNIDNPKDLPNVLKSKLLERIYESR